jgi:hypothetical protein
MADTIIINIIILIIKTSRKKDKSFKRILLGEYEASNI